MTKNANTGPNRSNQSELTNGSHDNPHELCADFVEKHGTGLFQITRDCNHGTG